MKDTLKPGIESTFTLRITEAKTVPSLYPEAPEFRMMPTVFATGFMVGFIEWACIKAINPHLDWPEEQTVGTQVNISHTAATPPGMEVTARVKRKYTEICLLMQALNPSMFTPGIITFNFRIFRMSCTGGRPSA
jgi:predicted thioesterase